MPKANEVKNVKKTAEADLKEVEKVTEVKTAPAKTIETKTEEAPVKEAEVKPVAEKKAAEKKPVEKKTVEKKATEKKATTTKKAAPAKKVAESVCIQYAGNEVEVSDILEKAKAAYGDAKAIKEIRVYVKPEEGMAYYVVNGEPAGSIAL